MRAGQYGGKTSIKIAKVTIIQLQYEEARRKIKESSHRHKSRKSFKMLGVVAQILKAVRT